MLLYIVELLTKLKLYCNGKIISLYSFPITVEISLDSVTKNY